MKQKQRIISMDMIRIFSCWCVITCHFNACISGFQNGVFMYQNFVVPSFYLENRVYLGDVGTCLFFMLSGASLMYSYKENNLKLYYKKRWLALYPMFYLAYIVATIVDILLFRLLPGGDLRLLFFSVIGFDGYLASLGWLGFDFYKLGEWFFGCIILLYLIFPLLYEGVKRKTCFTVFLVCIVYTGYSVLSHKQLIAYVPNYFFLRIPELLFGMLYVKYDLRRKPVFMLVGTVLFAMICWLLRNQIYPLTLCISICAVLFSGMSLIGNKIEGKRIRKFLLDLAGLTYPVFLVHHWMISRMVLRIDISSISLSSSWLLYGGFLVLSFGVAYMLKYITNKIIETIGRKKQKIIMK